MITLNAEPAPRAVTLTGDDGVARAEATAVVSGLLGDPPGVLLTSSCSSALEAAASMLDLRPGDEVVVPAFTFPTSASPFLARGASVRFADVDLATANVDAPRVREVLTERTRAVVLTHYAGVGIDLGDLAPELEARGIDIVEDAAHGLFASIGGVPLGRAGRFGCISFHRTKNISALEGGALVVNRPEDLDAALVSVDKGTNRVRFDQGRVPAYEWMGLGSGWRMPEASVAYLTAELARREAIQHRRQEIAAQYLRELSCWASEVGIPLPVVGPGRSGPAHLFHLVLASGADRAAFVAHCQAHGVQTARHYGSLPHSWFGQRIRHPDDACPNARRLEDGLVRLPLHHDLSEADVVRVVEAVSSWRP